MYLFLFALSLRRCMQALAAGSWGHSLLWCMGFSTQALGAQASGVVAHQLSCSTACGIFLDQGLNPCPLHRQAESYQLCQQGSSQSYS